MCTACWAGHDSVQSWHCLVRALSECFQSGPQIGGTSVPVPRVMWTTARCGRIQACVCALSVVHPSGGAELRPAVYISAAHQKPTLVGLRALHDSAGVIRCGTALASHTFMCMFWCTKCAISTVLILCFSP